VIPTAEHLDEPPWLRLARAEFGVREIPGPEANARILSYFALCNVIPESGDETPWCSVGAGWVCEKAGYRSPRSARARAWLPWGVAVKPRIGAFTVLSRGPDPRFGHVGLWIGQSHDRVLLLGGNQGNGWSISAYEQARVIGYRWPAELCRNGVPLEPQPWSLVNK
jgi:uncharacterized protein (TIGR02594 family)